MKESIGTFLFVAFMAANILTVSIVLIIGLLYRYGVID